MKISSTSVNRYTATLNEGEYQDLTRGDLALVEARFKAEVIGCRVQLDLSQREALTLIRLLSLVKGEAATSAMKVITPWFRRLSTMMEIPLDEVQLTVLHGEVEAIANDLYRGYNPDE